MSRKAWRKVNAKGRNKHAKHVRLYGSMMDSAAWRNLPPTARCVWLELKRRYNGSNNGEIPLSCREAAKLVNVSKDTAARALRMLQERGFAKIGRPSGFNVKIRLSTRWILTDEPLGDCRPTNEWRDWRPGKNLEHGPMSGTYGQTSGTVIPISVGESCPTVR